MKTYAVADMHGYPLEKFEALLEKAGFTDEDYLYVLGDVVDRNGDGGVRMLRRFMEMDNVEFILGNHEGMLLLCSFLFEGDEPPKPFELDALQYRAYEHYKRNGGGVTIDNLFKLRETEPDAISDIMDFIREAPTYAAVSCGGRDFILTHAGLGKFTPEKKLSEYALDELIWTRPTIETEYFDDIITVFGHTPTFYYGLEHEGKILRTRTWIDIDTGPSRGLPPALLRLDDLEVFYGE